MPYLVECRTCEFIEEVDDIDEAFAIERSHRERAGLDHPVEWQLVQ